MRLMFWNINITLLSSPSTPSPSSSMMSYTTPRTLLTTSGSSAELSAVAGAMISVVRNWLCWVIPEWRTVSRAVECDMGERTAEHTRPPSFTSESWGNKQKTGQSRRSELVNAHRKEGDFKTGYFCKWWLAYVPSDPLFHWAIGMPIIYCTDPLPNPRSLQRKVLKGQKQSARHPVH